MALLPTFAQVADAATVDGNPNSGQSPSRVPVNRQVEELSDEVEDFEVRLESAEKSFDRIVFPITVLVAILTAGGLLGIVYSFRDQRRSGQLHELTVGGEIAAQRRSEQSYGSFFEQSQTTLSLVNDTLGLAKEASDRAMQSTKNKAQDRVDDIEEQSRTLLMDVFTEEEFELIISDQTRRDKLHDIARELRSLEGYLSLQDIELPQHTKFVKALDQFLLDDTDAAIQALRLASQEGAVGDLRHFIEYWLGYMLTTIGEYGEALRKFHPENIALKEDDPEYFQVQRIIAETKFFLKAKENPGDETPGGKKADVTLPPVRFELVADLLDDLRELAESLEASANDHAKAHTRLEIARTRADIYEWVAYDPKHLDDPLGPEAFAIADAVVTRNKEAGEIVNANEFMSGDAWKELQAPNAFRTWALRQALAICRLAGDRENRNLDVEFALAECLFKLGEAEAAGSAFVIAEEALHREADKLHEKRKSVSIHQSVLICHCRLLKLVEEEEEAKRKKGLARDKELAQKEELIRRARDASSKTIALWRGMRQGGVTIFSQIQRRNISQDAFKQEVQEIGQQAKIWTEDS